MCVCVQGATSDVIPTCRGNFAKLSTRGPLPLLGVSWILRERYVRSLSIATVTVTLAIKYAQLIITIICTEYVFLMKIDDTTAPPNPQP